jgi:hypothetical protein
MTKTEAAIQIVQACIDWAEDTGDCHFCGDWQRKRIHDEDCPVREYTEAVEDGFLGWPRGWDIEVVEAPGDRCGNTKRLPDGSACPGCRACA